MIGAVFAMQGFGWRLSRGPYVPKIPTYYLQYKTTISQGSRECGRLKYKTMVC